MLVVGMLGGAFEQGGYHPTGLTQPEQVTHITLWSMLAAPLLIGADLTQLDEFTKALLMNDEVLDVNQDHLGKEAKRVKSSGAFQVWQRPLADGSTAVAVFNTSGEDQTADLDNLMVGVQKALMVRDLWQHKSLGLTGLGIKSSIPSHGALLVKVGNVRRKHRDR
jgi:alpha-galactosidase